MHYVRTQHGLSLVETVVVTAIFTLIIVALFGSVQLFYRGNSYTLEQALAVNSARKGVEFLVRDLREATLSDEGNYPIIKMGSTTLQFYSDIDDDMSVERVRYTFIDGTLYKAVTQPSGTPPTYLNADEATSTIAEYVRNEEDGIMLFEYFTNEGEAITDYSDVADVVFIRVNLVVNVNPQRLPNEFTLRSSATLRNLKPH